MKCPNCKKEVNFEHQMDEAHGIPGTYMAGSECFQCPKCHKSFHKAEGEKHGLVYNFKC